MIPHLWNGEGWTKSVIFKMWSTWLGGPKTAHQPLGEVGRGKRSELAFSWVPGSMNGSTTWVLVEVPTSQADLFTSSWVPSHNLQGISYIFSFTSALRVLMWAGRWWISPPPTHPPHPAQFLPQTGAPSTLSLLASLFVDTSLDWF